MSAEVQSWITWAVIGWAAGWLLMRVWSTWKAFDDARCGGGACRCSERDSPQHLRSRLQLGVKRHQQGLTIGKPASHQPR